MTSKIYGVVAPNVLKSYDGLGFLKAIVDGTVPNPPFSELMGFHLVEAEEGRAVFEGVPEFRHYNPIGTVHGGFAATRIAAAQSRRRKAISGIAPASFMRTPRRRA